MSIVIFGDLFSFPEGNAATNRVYSYAQGFHENGKNTYVICFLNEYLEHSEGISNQIKYFYPFRQKTRSRYFIVRRWKKLVKYFNTLSLIRKINQEDRVIAVNVWTNFLSTHVFAWVLSKLFKSTLIAECSEHPYLRRSNRFTEVYMKGNMCDGILCISRFLKEFYINNGIDQRKLLHVPSTVDNARFIAPEKRLLPFSYIGYFGSLTFKRDNVDLLLKSFSRICQKFPQVHLVLGGFCSQTDREHINNLIDELQIVPKVRLLEYAGRQEIAWYIAQATVLVMVRSNTMQAQASFPSKLTEFLATGKPVVTVNTGEVSDYLTDNVNAFLVEPEDCDALTEKLDFVLSNYESAELVGHNGRELTETVFNYRYQTKRIIDFISALNN